MSNTVGTNSFCASCGAALEIGSRFCGKCGISVIGTTSSSIPNPASVVANQSAVAAANYAEQPRGMGGWLLFFTIGLSFSIPLFALSTVGLFRQNDLFGCLMSIALTAICSTAAYKLWTKDFQTLKWVRITLLSAIVLGVTGLIGSQSTTYGHGNPEEAQYGMIVIISSLAWLAYFWKSVRVRNTFPARSTRVRKATFGGSAPSAEFSKPTAPELKLGELDPTSAQRPQAMPAVTATSASMSGPATTLAATRTQPIIQSVLKTPYQTRKLWVWIGAVIVIVVVGSAWNIWPRYRYGKAAPWLFGQSLRGVLVRVDRLNKAAYWCNMDTSEPGPDAPGWGCTWVFIPFSSHWDGNTLVLEDHEWQRSNLEQWRHDRIPTGLEPKPTSSVPAALPPSAPWPKPLNTTLGNLGASATNYASFVPAGELVNRLSVGEYEIRFYRTIDVSMSLEILKNGKRVFGLTDSTVAVPDTIGPVGRDITGNGVPDLIVSEYSGGAHCCTTYYVLELGTEFREIGHFGDLEGDEGDAQEFQDLLHDAHLEFVSDLWHAEKVYAFHDGSYRPVIELMRKPAPTQVALAANADNIRNSEQWRDTPDLSLGVYGYGPEFRGKPTFDLVGYTLRLVDSGHADLAFQFVEIAWPTGRAGKEEFVEDVRKCIDEDPDLRALNDDTAQPAPSAPAPVQAAPSAESAPASSSEQPQTLPSNSATIAQYLYAGQLAMQKGQLLGPVGNNVIFWARRVKQLDPTNSQANSLEQQASNMVLNQISHAIAIRQYNTALAETDELIASFPSNDNLLKMRQTILQQEQQASR